MALHIEVQSARQADEVFASIHKTTTIRRMMNLEEEPGASMRCGGVGMLKSPEITTLYNIQLIIMLHQVIDRAEAKLNRSSRRRQLHRELCTKLDSCCSIPGNHSPSAVLHLWRPRRGDCHRVYANRVTSWPLSTKTKSAETTSRGVIFR